MKITVLGESTIEAFPERAEAILGVGYEGENRAKIRERTSMALLTVVDKLSELESRQPNPITWRAVLPTTHSNWTEHNSPVEKFKSEATVKARFRNFDALAEFIDWCGAAGGVYVRYVRWDLTTNTRATLSSKVLGQAVEAGRRRAQTIADAAGIGVVRFVEIGEPSVFSAHAKNSVYSARFESADSHLSLEPEHVRLTDSVVCVFEA